MEDSGSEATDPEMPEMVPAKPSNELPPGLQPPKPLSKEELSQMSKFERRRCYEARGIAPEEREKPKTRAERREAQEKQRAAKEAKIRRRQEAQARRMEAGAGGGLLDVREDSPDISSEDEDEEWEDDETDDLLSSARRWMLQQSDEGDLRQAEVNSQSLNDFNLQVRFQGHSETTTSDHLRAVLQVVVEEGCSQVDLGKLRLLPLEVADAVEGYTMAWAPMLEALFSSIPGALAGPDVVLQAVQAGVDAQGPNVPEEGKRVAEVGCLMALRGIDLLEDADIVVGCRRAGLESPVMTKFLQFLEELEEDEDG